MLSKSKGQVLRVSAAIHVLINDRTDEEGGIIVSPVPNEIADEAIIAAKNFVRTCCQHASYIGGKGLIEDEVASSSPENSEEQ